MINLLIKKVTCYSVISLMAMSAFSQTEWSNALQKQFITFQTQNFQEKLYIHTDKTFYLAGEIIWFKIYDVDEYFHKPLSINTVTYVEIINRDQKPVLQAKIDMGNGVGNGSFSIPASIVSGNYKLRACTNWMKNFSPDYYFEQTISIVNTLKGSVSFDQPDRHETFNIQLFPEGGNLVYGLLSKIAFKAINQYGKGVECTGIIINQNKDTVTRFQSQRFGMGSFFLAPQSGEVYNAIITVKDTSFSQKLPFIYTQGYVMNVKDTIGNKIKVTVQSNISYLNPQLYLLVHTRQLIKNTELSYLNNQGIAVFYIEKSTLGDGISNFTLFNAEKQPICERLYFKRPENKLIINAATDQTVYNTRSKINLDLATVNQLNLPVNANMSLSVFLLDSMQLLPEDNIQTSLMLTSDLKGRIESPAYYFKNTDSAANELADNLMLTQGWRRFKWEDIFKNSRSYFDFLPEFEGPEVKGRIIDKNTNLPLRNTMVYLSIPGKKFSLATSVSDTNGNLEFSLDKFYGNTEFIVQANTLPDKKFSIDINSSFSDKFSETLLPSFSFMERWKDQLLYRSINMQAENTYLAERKRRFSPVIIPDTTMFYGYPDKEYYLDDYTRFITMEEVLKEYVKEVRVKKQSGNYYFQVQNATLNTFFEDNALTLIDGVPVFDINKIMTFDPLKVKSIEIIPRKYYLGSLAANGIISYRTYDNDLGGYDLDPNSVVLEYEGLQHQREFYSPVYETDDQVRSRIPDYRNLLFWCPEIKTFAGDANKLTFYSSDLTGNFAILIQGLTPDGLAGSTILNITVSKR